MRRLLPALLLIAACGGSSAPAPQPTPTPEPARVVDPGPSRVEDHAFLSKALGVEKKFRVWLPAGYDADPQRRWPVVYMLHGLGGNERNWIERGKLDVTADAIGLEAIVVMPDGDAGFYANAVTPPDREHCLRKGSIWNEEEPAADYCVERAAYEDYIVRDLVGHIDATFRTIARRDGRGLGGLSMGGFGSLILAMRHPDVFATAASHSGVDALLYAGPYPYRRDAVQLLEDVKAWGKAVEPIGQHVRSIFGKDLANWRAHDPAHLATELQAGTIALYLDCGTEDEFLLQNGAQYLHDVLTERGIDHVWHLGPGHHDFAFWAERLDDSLRFQAAHLARQ